jgi:hypothetical protein
MNNSPWTGPADAPPGLRAAAGLDRAGRGGGRVHLPVLQRARAVAARKEHQNVARKRPDPAFADDRAGAAENAFAAAGLVGSRRAVAQGDGERALSTGKQVVARLRVAEGDQAMEVLAPFVVDGGPTVLVDRGYVRPLPGSRVPPIAAPPREAVTITGRLRDSEGPVLDKKSFVSDGVRQVYSINTSQIAMLIGAPLTGSYLQLVDNQPGGLGVIGLPHLDAGPFLSYGIQWITFGVVAPILLGYFVFAEVRARRAERAAAAQPAEKSAPASVEDKLTDRYGRRR